MKQNRFIKEHLRYEYSWFNHGKSGRQAKRNRILSQHMIRQQLKRELEKEVNMLMSE